MPGRFCTTTHPYPLSLAVSIPPDSRGHHHPTAYDGAFLLVPPTRSALNRGPPVLAPCAVAAEPRDLVLRLVELLECMLFAPMRLPGSVRAWAWAWVQRTGVADRPGLRSDQRLASRFSGRRPGRLATPVRFPRSLCSLQTCASAPFWLASLARETCARARVNAASRPVLGEILAPGVYDMPTVSTISRPCLHVAETASTDYAFSCARINGGGELLAWAGRPPMTSAEASPALLHPA